MAINTSLKIALFEENPRLFALLSAILVKAGHSVSMCSKDGYPLATFLQEFVEELRQSSHPYYDLCIIDVSDTLPSYEIVTLLEYIVRERSLPLILLTEADNRIVKLLKIKVAIVPVLFHTVLRMQDVFTAIETTMGMSMPLSVPELRKVQQSTFSTSRRPSRLAQPGLRLAAHGSINARNGSARGSSGYPNDWCG